MCQFASLNLHFLYVRTFLCFKHFSHYMTNLLCITHYLNVVAILDLIVLQLNVWKVCIDFTGAGAGTGRKVPMFIPGYE